MVPKGAATGFVCALDASRFTTDGRATARGVTEAADFLGLGQLPAQ